MGSIHEYSTKQGKRYMVRYRKPDRSQATKRGFTRKVDALQFMATVEVEMSRSQYIDPRNSRVDVGILGEAWIAEQRMVLKPSTFHSLESAWRIHVQPRWSKVKVSDVLHSDVRAWVAELTAGRSASTVLRAHGILAAILDIAARDRRIAMNPARGIRMPRKVRRRHVYLSHEQVASLAQQSRYPELIYFLAYTGLRWGEATALRVRDIDLTRGRALIEENAVTVNGKVIIGTPKTHATRTVPIPPFLIPHFDALARVREPDALAFGDGRTHMLPPSSRDGWFAAAVLRCQKADYRFPRITPHDLRHTTASLAISAGANVKAVQRMLGHASAAMTLDTYADLFEDDLDTVSLALEAARRGSTSAPARSLPILPPNAVTPESGTGINR